MAYLRERGAWVWKVRDECTAGIPDIVGCYRGRFIAFEVKTDVGRVSKLQEYTIRQIVAAGGMTSVVRSIADVQALLDVGGGVEYLHV